MQFGSTTGRTVGVGLLVGLLLVGCGTDEPAPAEEDASTAQQVLDALAPPAGGEYPGGSFEFSRPIDGGSAGGLGRVASTSWDVYYVVGGSNGAWGAGLDVFDTADHAAQVTEDDAGFFCTGTRRAVDALADDGLWAYSCRRPTEGGFYATLDAVDGAVAANLTVSGPTRGAAEAALAAVWASLAPTVHEVDDALTAGS